MDKLHKLEIRKLLKEFDYFKSELDLKGEIIYEVDNSFLNSLNNLLDKSDDLKNIYNEKLDNVLDLDTKFDNTDIKNNEPEIEKNNNIKKIYRKIVKKTHPDIVNDLLMNNFYIKIVDMYEKNDIIGIYNICEQLDIDFEVPESDFEMIKSEILNLKQRIIFLESTFTWKWYNAKTESEKNKIILEYIRSKII